MKRERGLAVVTALLVVAVAASAAALMLSQQSAMLDQTAMVATRAQADAYALAGIDWARGVLAEDQRKGAVDSLDEGWAQPIAALPVERAVVSGLIVDEQGKFNLNNLKAPSGQDLRIFRTLLNSLGLPAEELLQVNQGDDFGWPYCYYDQRVAKLVLGPEYGGNRSTVGRCSTAKAPVTAFPGHWAPNGLVFYTGTSFPDRYRNGAFVAFHGSWNRSPQPQAGYLVAFVPADGNSLSSAYELFATGLAGSSTISSDNQAAHRPTGLAVDAGGALYITDDAHGRIWRVVYRGQ